MTTEIISIYHTKSGEVAIEVRKHIATNGRTSYGYIGKYGAGCAADFNDICVRVRGCLQYKRGYKLVFGLDIEKA